MPSPCLLHDCKTSNFANVRFQLYLTTLLSVLSVPRSQLGSNWREMRFKVCSIQRGKIVSTKPPPLSIKCVSYYLFVLRQYKVFSAVFGEKVKSWELTRAIAANVAPLLCWGNITRASTSKQLWSATAFNQQLLYTWRMTICVQVSMSCPSPPQHTLASLRAGADQRRRQQDRTGDRREGEISPRPVARVL